MGLADGLDWFLYFRLGYVKASVNFFSWNKCGNSNDRIYSRKYHYIANDIWLDLFVDGQV